MAEFGSGSVNFRKLMNDRQEKELIFMMRSYSPPPGHPRSGPSVEYSNAFWNTVSITLNILGPDVRYWRNKEQWRRAWRYYTARVKEKLNKNQKMTNFETEIAIFLQQNFLEESNIQIEEEDEYSVQNIQVQPDINESLPDEPATAPVRAQPVQRRRTTIQIEEEDEYSVENIQVQSDINETLPDEPATAPVRAQPVQRRRATVGFVDQANIDQASQLNQGTYFEPMLSTRDHNTNATQTQTRQTQTNETDFVQLSTSFNDQMNSNSPSTSGQDASEMLTRQLAALIESGKKMVQMASAIAVTFQETREQRRQETFANINGFRTENMETNTLSVPQNPSSPQNGAQGRSDNEDRNVIDLTD